MYLNNIVIMDFFFFGSVSMSITVLSIRSFVAFKHYSALNIKICITRSCSPWSTVVCCPSVASTASQVTRIRRAAKLFADRFNITRDDGEGAAAENGHGQILTLRPESMTRHGKTTLVCVSPCDSACAPARARARACG